MSDRNSPGEHLSRRLASRSEGGLYRRAMPDGGSVYTGPLARRALRAVGARAFTMDRSIFVDQDFDPSNAEDAALYAHESHHQAESGGSDAHSHRDAEEVAARAIERMVLHRMSAGEDFGAVMRDVRQGGARHAAPSAKGGMPAGPIGGNSENVGREDEVTAAYQALLAQGKSHDQIVNELAKHVIDHLSEMRQSTSLRKSRFDTF